MSDQDQDDTKYDANGTKSVPAPATGEGADVAARLAAALAERDESKDRLLRLAAEFENFKKRARKEQDDAEARVRESVLKDILDVSDNLERAVSAYGGPEGTQNAKTVDGPAILKGVGLVLRLFQSKLERYGVKVIEARGQPFDPRIHEAISRTESAEVPAGSVLVELQRGYRIGDRLLRPSMVSVAVAPAGQGGKDGGKDGGRHGGDGGDTGA